MVTILEHPEIGWMEATGYPSWAQDRQKPDPETWEDELYEKRREEDWEE